MRHLDFRTVSLGIICLLLYGLVWVYAIAYKDAYTPVDKWHEAAMSGGTSNTWIVQPEHYFIEFKDGRICAVDSDYWNEVLNE